MEQKNETNLRERIKNKLVTYGLAGILLGTSGCIGTATRMLGEQGMADNPQPGLGRGLGALYAIGGTVIEGAERQEQRVEVAREGRSQVNVYNENNSGQQRKVRVPSGLFACNYFKDLNGDGFVGDDEYVGIKKEFTTAEKITFVSIAHNMKGEVLKFSLFDQNERLVGQAYRTIDRTEGIIPFEYTNGLPPGYYTAILTASEDKKLGHVIVRVVKE